MLLFALKDPSQLPSSPHFFSSFLWTGFSTICGANRPNTCIGVRKWFQQRTAVRLSCRNAYYLFASTLSLISWAFVSSIYTALSPVIYTAFDLTSFTNLLLFRHSAQWFLLFACCLLVVCLLSVLLFKVELCRPTRKRAITKENGWRDRGSRRLK